MRTCLDCGKPLIGRSDKKFCSTLCRNTFNNSKLEKLPSLVKLVNKTLNKNRRLLKDCLIQSEKRVRKEVLEERGFNFKLYTSHEEYEKGKFLYRCYNYSYLISSRGVVYITDKKNSRI